MNEEIETRFKSTTIQLLIESDRYGYVRPVTEIYFKLTTDESNPNYIFTHKLTRLFPYLQKLIKKYGSDVDIDMRAIKDENSNDLLCNFNQFMVSTEEHHNSSSIVNDIIQLIAYVCNKNNKLLGIYYTGLYYNEKFYTERVYNYKYTKLNVISNSDCEKLFEKFDYSKIVPFDMGYCLRNEITLPSKIWILIEKFGIDIAEEIAKYLYVIYGK